MGTAPLLPVPRGAAPGARPGTAHTPPPLPPAPAAALGPVPPLTGHADSSAQPLRPTRCRRGGAPRPGPAHLGGTDGRTDARWLGETGRARLPPALAGCAAAPRRPPFSGGISRRAGGRARCCRRPPPRLRLPPPPGPARPSGRRGEERSGAERSGGGGGGARPLTPGPGRRRRGSVGGRCGEKPPPPQREGAGPPAPSLPFAAGRSKKEQKAKCRLLESPDSRAQQRYLERVGSQRFGQPVPLTLLFSASKAAAFVASLRHGHPAVPRCKPPETELWRYTRVFPSGMGPGGHRRPAVTQNRAY